MEIIGIIRNLLAVLSIVFALVGTIEELPVEELNPNHCEDELKEDVDNEDIEDILERYDDTVEDSF